MTNKYKKERKKGQGVWVQVQMEMESSRRREREDERFSLPLSCIPSIHLYETASTTLSLFSLQFLGSVNTTSRTIDSVPVKIIISCDFLPSFLRSGDAYSGGGSDGGGGRYGGGEGRDVSGGGRDGGGSRDRLKAG